MMFTVFNEYRIFSLGHAVGAFLLMVTMEITLGEKIEINGEVIPDYMAEAIFQHIKRQKEICHLISTGIDASKIKTDGRIIASGCSGLERFS